MISDWQFILLFVAIAVIFPGVPILLGTLVGPKRPNPIKQSTYECGIETVGDTWIQFKVQYYVYGLIFLIFDVEIIFILPWVLAYDKLGIFSFVAGIVFILLLLDGLVYAWGKGVLSWV